MVWTGGFTLLALLFPLLPNLGTAGRILAFFCLTLFTFPALLPWTNLRTRWYYLVILAPTALQGTILFHLLFPFGWFTAMCMNLLIITYAYSLAKLVGKAVVDTSLLLVVLIVSSVADIASILYGPASQMLHSPVAPYVLLSFPIPGTGQVDWLLGFGDVFIFILLAIFTLKNRLGTMQTVISQLVAVNLASLVSAVSHTVIPALPFQCLAFYLAHRGRLEWRMTSREWRLLMFAAVNTVVMLLFFQWVSPIPHTVSPGTPPPVSLVE